MPRKGKLFIISGPSGVGKGTLVKEILARVPNLGFSISETTRKPRSNEVDGRDYFFLKEEEFLEQVEKNHFLEWAKVYGHYYGTPQDEVQKVLDRGEDVILEIDVQGALQVLRKIPEAVSIFISPPSTEELERRLAERLTEDIEEKELRFKIARKELETASKFEYNIINDSMDEAIDDLAEIFLKNRE